MYEAKTRHWPAETESVNLLNALARATKQLDTLVAHGHQIAVEHGFTGATIGEEIALMHSELSEALEEHRAGRLPDAFFYSLKDGRVFDRPEDAGLDRLDLKPCGIPVELADVLIRVFDFCGKHKIDLARAVREKMIYNDKRPFRHGGKKL
jgi:NTP pyrophosphatase (non-canonical NTP hydrolase)